MRKRLILGDIHGHTSWKSIYIHENPDEVIVLGDYVDSFSVPPTKMVDNLKEMVETMRIHEKVHGPNTFIMLLGNHDFHYCDVGERYSGFSKVTYNLVNPILNKLAVESDKIKIVWYDKINNTIYSHAGITQTWWNLVKSEKKGFSEIEDINDLNWSYLRFTSREGGDFYGSSRYNGPLWVRPWTLQEDMLVNDDGVPYNQVVGHTHSDYIKSYYDSEYNPLLYVVDTLPKEYLVNTLDDNGKIVKEEIKESSEVLQIL